MILWQQLTNYLLTVNSKPQEVRAQVRNIKGIKTQPSIVSTAHNFRYASKIVCDFLLLLNALKCLLCTLL